MNKGESWKLTLAGITAVCLAAQTAADTLYVYVDDAGFSPSTLNINVGDTVVWVNNDESFPHTTTSDLQITDPDYWNGLLFDFEDTFQKTFNNPGTFTYHDNVDVGTGTIIVNAPPPQNIVLQSPRLESGQFLFDINGLTPGLTNVVQMSTNLVQWSAISTNIADSSSMTITNTLSSGMRSFRVVELK